MIEAVWSGGQTGGDRGGWDGAIAVRVPIGGFIPRGRRAEDGPIPDRYVGLVELPSPDYRDRTRQNIIHSDATVIFTLGAITTGSRGTAVGAKGLGKPFACIDLSAGEVHGALLVRDLIAQHQPRILNVAGSRESRAPGLQQKVADLIEAILRWERGER